MESLETYFKVFESQNKFDGQKVKDHVDKLKQLDQYFPPHQSYYIITNTTTGKFEFISANFEHTIGLSINKMYEEGLPYWLSRFCEEEFEIWTTLLAELMDYTMTKVSAEDRKLLSYSWNVRVKNSNDKLVNLYEHQTPLYFDQVGKPVIGVAYSTITGEGHPQPIIGSIKRLNKNQVFETIFHKNFSKDFFTKKISNREIDVLRLLAMGKTSKEIGDQLFISPHTVDGHRRNLIKKLDLSSTSELVNYCLRNQIF